MSGNNRWWENATVINFFSPKARGRTLKDIIEMLDDVCDWGFNAVWMGIPYHGGVQYYGLDVIDFFSVDPAIGSMEDFKELVFECHARKLQVLAAFNLGYSAMDFPQFTKACDDVMAGVDSPESRWFVWSDDRQTELDRSGVPFFMNDVVGDWHYSERGGKYYWVKWQGEKGDVNMPNFNYGDPGWQEECTKVIRFWMDTGIDGMIVDAVNWYTNCTWKINNETISDVVHERPNSFVLPEGGGGFEDDPVQWITHGHYDSVMDYGLSCWWRGTNAIKQAMQSGNPVGIESTLRRYRDRVVAAGGVTWAGLEWAWSSKGGRSIEQMFLETVVLATVGELFVGHEALLELPWSAEHLSKLKAIIKARSEYPALGALGPRRRLPTYNDKLYYAYLRSTPSGDQEMLVVLNFQSEHRVTRVYMDEPAELTDIFGGGRQTATSTLQLSLPPFGYKIFEVKR